MTKKKEESLEERLSQIEEMIRKMEEPEVSLDESFKLYQAGIEQLKHCNQMLDEVEKKMQILNKNGELTEF
mgnify:CR=1 FL=1